MVIFYWSCARPAVSCRMMAPLVLWSFGAQPRGAPPCTGTWGLRRDPRPALVAGFESQRPVDAAGWDRRPGPRPGALGHAPCGSPEAAFDIGLRGICQLAMSYSHGPSLGGGIGLILDRHAFTSVIGLAQNASWTPPVKGSPPPRGASSQKTGPYASPLAFSFPS